MGRLLTVGHGTLDRAGLGALLTRAGMDLLVDIRRFPGSRHNPDVGSDAMTQWLPEAGIDYRWEERLGGRRRCHRRIVADAAVLLRGMDVAHLGHDGRTTPHEPSAGACVVDGLLRYDVPAGG